MVMELWICQIFFIKQIIDTRFSSVMRVYKINQYVTSNTFLEQYKE